MGDANSDVQLSPDKFESYIYIYTFSTIIKAQYHVILSFVKLDNL